MQYLSDDDLFEEISTAIEDEENAQFNKGRRHIKAKKRRIEYELISRGFEKWHIYEKVENIIKERENVIEEPEWKMPEKKKLKSKILYVEYKGGELEGNARIGRVYFSKSGKSLYYDDKCFRSQKGSGFKSNYYDVDTGEEYWISGPRKDRNDRLYGGNRGVQVDEDIRESYLEYLRS